MRHTSGSPRSVCGLIPGLYKTLFITITLLLAESLFASTPTIKVVAPSAGASVGSPIYFEAYSYSSCAKGISKMSVYSAPSVEAYTTTGSHIETFITLSAGSYSTQIEAWDNCGGVSTTDLGITVTAATGVTVFLPSSSSASVPIHVAASAQSSTCDKGINAMRIYTSPGVGPYTILGNQLDAFVNLAAGSYGLVVQAWDNCGNVLKNSFTETATQVPDSYLYGINYTTLFDIPLTNGNLGTATLITPESTGQLNQVVVDPGGDFVYVSTYQGTVYAYQIDRQNGSLFAVPGSPFSIATGGGVVALAMDPNGQFLYIGTNYSSGGSQNGYVGSYYINRSNGALSESEYMSVAPIVSLATNYTGAFLYAMTIPSANTAQIWAYTVNSNSGLLSPYSWTPYTVPGSIAQYGPFELATDWKYLYALTTYQCNSDGADCEQIWAYDINSDASLTEIAGSPFDTQAFGGFVQPFAADWLTRYDWLAGQITSTGENVLESGAISYDTGALGAFTNTNTGQYDMASVAEDHSGNYLYTGGTDYTGTTCLNTGYCPMVVESWTIGSTDVPTPLSTQIPGNYISGIPIFSIATSR
jgi:hypothetical protein